MVPEDGEHSKFRLEPREFNDQFTCERPIAVHVIAQQQDDIGDFIVRNFDRAPNMCSGYKLTEVKVG